MRQFAVFAAQFAISLSLCRMQQEALDISIDKNQGMMENDL
jgi:hypothetical protein